MRNVFGALLALIAANLYAAFNIAAKRELEKQHPVTNVVLLSAGMFLIGLLFSPFAITQGVASTRAATIALIMGALFFVSDLCWVGAYHYASVGTVTIILAMIPVFSILGNCFLDWKLPTAREITAYALVVAAIVVLMTEKKPP